MVHGGGAVGVLGDGVLGLGSGEDRRVDSRPRGRLDGPDDPEGSRVDATGEDVGLQCREVVDQDRVGRVGGRHVRRLDLDVEPPVAVDDVVTAPTLDEVGPAASEEDVASVEGRHTRSEDRLQSRDAGDAVGGELVVGVEVGRRPVVAAQRVVEVPPGQCLDEVEAVLVGLHRRRQRSDDLHVGVRRERIALVGGPVEAEHPLRALDAVAEQHDVVAALAVVVGLAAVAHQHVVTGLVRVVLERGAVVALQQVERATPTLHPVVAVVAEDRVLAVTGHHVVVTGTGERLGHVVATDDEVVATTALVEVGPEALARGQRVVAVASLERVVAGRVVEDVVAEATDQVVDAVTSLHPVVAAVATDGVVALAGPDPVVHRRVGAGRQRRVAAVDAVEDHVRGSGVPERAVGHPCEQRRLVPVLRCDVVGHTPGGAEVGHLEHEVRPGEDVCRQRGHVGVAHDELGERVALELRQQVEARGAGQVVEPVAVLEVLHLLLEHVVERRAEETAEDHRLLRETTHPEVDVLEAR